MFNRKRVAALEAENAELKIRLAAAHFKGGPLYRADLEAQNTELGLRAARLEKELKPLRSLQDFLRGKRPGEVAEILAWPTVKASLEAHILKLQARVGELEFLNQSITSEAARLLEQNSRGGAIDYDALLRARARRAADALVTARIALPPDPPVLFPIAAAPARRTCPLNGRPVEWFGPYDPLAHTARELSAREVAERKAEIDRQAREIKRLSDHSTDLWKRLQASAAEASRLRAHATDLEKNLAAARDWDKGKFAALVKTQQELDAAKAAALSAEKNVRDLITERDRLTAHAKAVRTALGLPADTTDQEVEREIARLVQDVTGAEPLVEESAP